MAEQQKSTAASMLMHLSGDLPRTTKRDRNEDDEEFILDEYDEAYGEVEDKVEEEEEEEEEEELQQQEPESSKFESLCVHTEIHDYICSKMQLKHHGIKFTAAEKALISKDANQKKYIITKHLVKRFKDSRFE